MFLKNLRVVGSVVCVGEFGVVLAINVVLVWFLSYERGLLWVIRFGCWTECRCVTLHTLSTLTLYRSIQGGGRTNDRLGLNGAICLFLGRARIVVGVAICAPHVSTEETIACEGEGANNQHAD